MFQKLLKLIVLSLGIEGKKLSKELQQKLKEQEEEPENFKPLVLNLKDFLLMKKQMN